MWMWPNSCFSTLYGGLVEEVSSQDAVYIIKRLWRDVFNNCTILFISWRPLIHLFCLHYIFRPRINIALQKFQYAWNSHPMSTTSNLSPNLQGIAANGFAPEADDIDTEVRTEHMYICMYVCTVHVNVTLFFCKIVYKVQSRSYKASLTVQDYGIDWDGPITESDDDADQVVVPECNCLLTEEQLIHLQETISPLDSSHDYGINLFNAEVIQVQDLLNTQ